MEPYSLLNITKLSFDGYSIIPFREEDIFAVKNWRNEQMDVLRQKTILTDADQVNYYNNRVKPSFLEERPLLMLFSYMDRNNICIGYGGLTNIDWQDRRAEISFLMETKMSGNREEYKKGFGCFLQLMKMLAFTRLNINRLFTETYDLRPLHISILETSGFKLEGRMKEHVYINGNYIDSLLHGCLKSYYESEK